MLSFIDQVPKFGSVLLTSLKLKDPDPPRTFTNTESVSFSNIVFLSSVKRLGMSAFKGANVPSEVMIGTSSESVTGSV